MSKKIYVGSLPYSTTESELQGLFEGFGEVVEAKIISDKFSGKSKGFGFVEMSDGEAADQAISQLNESEFKGRNLVVNEARPRESRPPRRGGGGGGGGGGYGGGGGGGGNRRDSGRRQGGGFGGRRNSW